MYNRQQEVDGLEPEIKNSLMQEQRLQQDATGIVHLISLPKSRYALNKVIQLATNGQTQRGSKYVLT